ncbi:MAG: sugar porter family MFS transporter [Paludibacteraceae bacterium]
MKTLSMYNKNFVWIIAAIAATGGLLFGFDTGVISGAIPFLRSDFVLSDNQVENLTAFGLIGAVIGALICGRITDILGRRKVILASAFVFATGALWSGFAPNIAQLLLSRLYLGLAIGVSSFATPLYIAEVSPTKIRGTLVSMFQLLITVGILAAYMSDSYFADNNNPESWRPMFYVGVIPAIILFVGMSFLPETPRWLMGKGRDNEARRVLSRTEDPALIDQAIENMKKDIQQDAEQMHWTEIFKPWLFNAMIIAVGIMFFQQFVGINTVIYYSPEIFLKAGFEGNQAAIAASVSVGVVNVLFTILSLFLIDKLGRRKLFFIGTTGIFFSLLLIGFCFAFSELLGDYTKIVLVACMLCYIAFFAISLGPLGWLIISEVFPLKVRGLGSSIGSLANWGFNTLVVWTFFKMIDGFNSLFGKEEMGTASAFWVFAAVAIIALIWGYFFIPETKGVSLEKIEEHWRKGGSPRKL